jgi:8-oxo-dGTP pyrophosphatase MutT (NUDIX family)
MGIDFRAVADGMYVEPEPPATVEAPPTCSYCGSTEFSGVEDHGRGTRATCSACGGTMTSDGQGYWQPELIGSPKNHPRMNADPASGGVPGVWAPVLRTEDLSESRQRISSADWCRHRHAEHCWLPKDATNGSVALYVPQDRGRCPWTTPSQQQINCPVSEPGPMAGMSRSAKFGERTDLTWDEIGARHPHMYGDPDVHGLSAYEGDGPGIGAAANYLAHSRPESDAEDHSVHDLTFREMKIDPKHIDYAPSAGTRSEGRMHEAYRSFSEGRGDDVPPIVVVHRHGVYQPADGHHRSEGAHLAGTKLRAYVANSPYPDEPDHAGERAPYNGRAVPTELEKTAAQTTRPLERGLAQPLPESCPACGPHTAAPIPAPMRNPLTGKDFWFHGTRHDPKQDTAYRHEFSHMEPHQPRLGDPEGAGLPSRQFHGDPGGTLRPPERDEYEFGQHADKHWNTDLGVHYTSEHSTAHDLFAAKGGVPNSRIAHTKLHMANPIHFHDEQEFGHHAASWMHQQGHRLLPTDEDSHEAFRNGDDFDIGDGEGSHAYLGEHFQEHDKHLRTALSEIDQHGPQHHHSMDHVDHWIAKQPERTEATAAYRDHLKSQGHDGVIYGNSYEGTKNHKCAIAFPDSHAHIHKWEWLHPDNEHKNPPAEPEHEHAWNQHQLLSWDPREWPGANSTVQKHFPVETHVDKAVPPPKPPKKPMGQPKQFAAPHGVPQMNHIPLDPTDTSMYKQKSAAREELRFHLTATWADVRNKAKRIRSEGGVHIVVASGDGIGANVLGDTGVYETILSYRPGSYKVSSWECGCAWAAYAFNRSPAYRRFEGRMCSHALALQFEAQARGMFGRTVGEDSQRPDWLRDKARQRYLPDVGTHVLVNARRDPDGFYPDDHGLDLVHPPVYAFVVDALSRAEDPGDAVGAMLAVGMAHTAARSLLREAMADPAAQPSEMALLAAQSRTAALPGPKHATRCPDCGAEINSSMNKCPHCGANLNMGETGDQHLAALPARSCPTCKGTGELHSEEPLFDDTGLDYGTEHTVEPCEDCEGSGRQKAMGDTELEQQARETYHRMVQAEAEHMARFHANGETTQQAARNGAYCTPTRCSTKRGHPLPPEQNYVNAHVKKYSKIGSYHDHDPSEDVWWHGTATGDLRGGSYGLHVGTHKAATEAVTARIGHPVEGEWDGTREYGRTLLAGKNTLQQRGIYPTGHNMGVPDHDHYPDPKGHFPHDSHVSPESKPNVFPLIIHGEMANTPHEPESDHVANTMMARQRGRENGRGVYYRNVGEDAGSVSAALPHHTHIQPISRGRNGVDYHGTSQYHRELTDADYSWNDDEGDDWHRHGAKDEDSGPTHAGLVLKAEDTGRILMLQRSHKDEDDPARGTWEFPGGGLEEHDSSSLHGAAREFAEEIGQRVPHGGTVQHVWRSGPYQGHVLVIPKEEQITLHDGRVVTNPDDPDGDDPEQAAWWDPDHARKNPALREECKGAPWKAIKEASRGGKLAAFRDRIRQQAEYASHDPLGDFAPDPPAQRPDPKPGAQENPGSTGFATGADPAAFDAADARSMRLPEMGSWASRTTQEEFAHRVMDRYHALGNAQDHVDSPAERQVAMLHNGYDDETEYAEDVAHGDLGIKDAALDEPLWSHVPTSVADNARRVAELHDEPEPALPATTGGDDDEDGWTSQGVDPANQHIDVADTLSPREDPRDEMRSEISPSESVNPNSVHASRSVEDIVAEFQRTAGAASLMASGGGQGVTGSTQNPTDQDIAAAARAHLQKAALKDFSFSEQQELIGEGAHDGTRARNLGDLQIEGTHYAALEDALADHAQMTDTDALFI